MNDLSAYLFICGLICIWPIALFGFGFYLGRHGSPLMVRWRGERTAPGAGARRVPSTARYGQGGASAPD